MYTGWMVNLSYRLLALIALVFTMGLASIAFSQATKEGPVVYLAQVDGMIDLGLAPYI